MPHKWYCQDCGKEISKEEGPLHVWNTKHKVDYTDKDQTKLTDFNFPQKL